MVKEIQPQTMRNIQEIINLLKQVGKIHIRGISRSLEFNPFTVSRIIEKYLDPFININYFDEFGFRFKIIELKPNKQNIDLTDVLSYYNIKKQIKGQIESVKEEHKKQQITSALTRK